jgi:hypothetical protein
MVSTVLRDGAVSDAGGAAKGFSGGNPEKWRIRTRTCGHPHKKRFQGFARNRMTSASGITWFAREPKLMVGAEGRASAQRLSEYHVLPCFAGNDPGNVRNLKVNSHPGRAAVSFARTRFSLLIGRS